MAGFAAPRYTADLGHSPAALPILLGEVFQIVCPLQKVFLRQTCIVPLLVVYYEVIFCFFSTFQLQVTSVLNNSLSRYNLATKNRYVRTCSCCIVVLV